MSKNNTPEIVEAELVSSEIAIRAGYSAEIDSQIATAKSYPRSISRCLSEATALAIVDQDTAAGMFYCMPRGDKQIEGPSVRLAELIVYAWTNIRAHSEIIAIDDKHITARGYCIDLERNNAQGVTVKSRITYKNGSRYNDDMIVVAGNAACAKAFRNAVFKVIPASIVRPVYLAAKKAAVGDAKTLTERVERAVAWFAKQDVSAETLCTFLGVAAVSEISLEHLNTLTGLRTAILDGDTTAEAVFSDERESAATSDLNRRLKGVKHAKTKPTKKELKNGGSYEAVTEEEADAALMEAFGDAQ